MKPLALFFVTAALSAQVQPAPGWCSMAHCNNHMTDFAPVTPPGLTGGLSIVARDTARLGVLGALGCVSNGTNIACSYRESPDALVYYDANGNVLWTSGDLLDINTYRNTPIIQADGSVVLGDDLHTIKFNRDGTVAWSTPAPEGSPISQVTTPNGAIFTASHPVAVDTCPQFTCSLMVSINNQGRQYTSAAVTFTGGDCPGAQATATVSSGKVTGVTVTTQGAACMIAPDVIITGDGVEAQANAQVVAPSPVAAYDGSTGALVGSMLLYSSGVSGPYYETINVPCVNNGSHPNRVYVSTNLNTNDNQGALWALDIDPTNLASPIVPAWSISFGGPSGASPLCIGDNVYFDGAGYVPGDNAGTTIFGIQDNGNSAKVLFHQSLGAGTQPVTCNFAMDPRPVGGFWHEVEYDTRLYHRDGLSGNIIETLDISALLAAHGAVPGTYWMSGVFNTVGTPDHPYMILPEEDTAYAASYLTMVDLTNLSLVWSLPLYPGNSPFYSDSFEGGAAIVTNGGGEPVLAMTTRYNGAFFMSDGPSTVALSSSSLSFGDQAVGATSSSQSVTLTNTASSGLAVVGVNVTGDFTQTNTCTSPLPAGTACAITIRFAPTATGPRNGSLTVASNAANSPQTISLSGVGVSGVATASLSAGVLTFSGQVYQTTSPAQVVTLSNSGSVPMAIGSIASAGDAIQTNNCPANLPPGSICSINVMFGAGGVGPRSGTVTVNSNASNNPQAVTINGMGLVAHGPAAGLSLTSLVFPTQAVGASSQPQAVHLVNSGSAPLSIAGISAQGAASQVNSCPATLAPKAYCSISITFTPPAVGPGGGTITVADNAPDSPQTVLVSGEASGNPVPFLSQATAPSNPIAGGSGFALKVLGGGFLSNAVVNWNGAPLATTYTSKTLLSATVPADHVATAGTAAITVSNPGPGGGLSNPVWFPFAIPSAGLSMGRLDLQTGTAPQAVATADLDGDGKLDLVIANSGAGTLSVRLGIGDGTFSLPTNFLTGADPVAIAVADFNGDGMPDIVAANQGDNTVSMLLAAGGGAFAQAVPYPTGNGPVALVAADFNGDGALDLAVANQGDNTISILLGNANGTFDAHVDCAAGSSPRALAAGDFNQDGKLDLAVANDYADGTVSILLGKGDGTFQAPVPYPTGDSVAVAAADFNGDGKLDLAAVNQDAQTLTVLIGNGNGTFQPALTKLLELSPSGIAIADMNADGTLDVVVANSALSTISIYDGFNDGYFQDPSDYDVASGPQALVLGDFNGDGSLDVAIVAADSNTLSILMQAPAATFSSPSIDVGNVTIGSPASAGLTLTNTGSAPLNIASITAGGAFSQQNQCPRTLAAGLACTITVTATASAKGPLSGVLTITDNVPGSPQIIALSGVGVAGKVSLVLSRTSVDSGNPVQSNTVSLNYAAPPGGAVFILASSNPEVASVPGSITIPAGSQVSPPFSITTAGVGSTVPVTLSATFNGVTATAILNVNPATLKSLSLSPASVSGGGTTTANFAILDGQAPPAGAILSLTTSNPAIATVPASIQIPAYATQSPNFTITTSPVTTSRQVTIIATYGKLQATAPLTVNPGGLVSLNLSPNPVVGGTLPPSYNNVAVLGGPAPPSGAVVALSSSNPAVASVQANVKVAAGSTTSANFPIATTAVAVSTPVTIAATYQGITKQMQLVVNIATPAAVLLSDTTVKGGTTVPFNTVLMDGPAPAGGLTVTLSSSNPGVASVPATVTVAAGSQTSAPFSITTSHVLLPKVVAISATYHGITQSANLTVGP